MQVTIYGIEESKKAEYISSLAQNAELYNMRSITVGFDNQVSSYKRVCIDAKDEPEANAILFAANVAVDMKDNSTNPVELELHEVDPGHKSFHTFYSKDSAYVLELAKENVGKAVNYKQLGEEEEQEEMEEDLPEIEYRSLEALVKHYKCNQ